MNLLDYEQSELETANLELQRLNSELKCQLEQQTERLECARRELEALLYSISHDLPRPVRKIDAFSRIVMDEYTQMFPPEVQKYLSMIRESAAELDRLLSGILNCSGDSSAAWGKAAT